MERKQNEERTRVEHKCRRTWSKGHGKRSLNGRPPSMVELKGSGGENEVKTEERKNGKMDRANREKRREERENTETKTGRPKGFAKPKLYGTEAPR